MQALFCAPLALVWSNVSTETAVANGDTRTLSFHHMHTGEDFTITFKRNGYFDEAALEKLNWGLRDWRIDEPTKMDPRLFDIVWEVYRETGSSETVHVVSAYRSPQTNAMLRRRSHQVAEHSQHMLGKAMDFFLPDVSMAKVREIGLRLQRGGVGYYPNANTVFVHLDAGGVRYWPRMSRDQLARVFPDGKTVLIPTDGQPMPGYQEALAEIEGRGGTAVAYNEKPTKGLLSWLFGGSNEEDEDTAAQKAAPANQAKNTVVASATPADNGDENANSKQPANKATMVANLEAKKPGVLSDETSDGMAKALTEVPLPPARPTSLQQFALNGPVPPTRPVELALLNPAKPDPIARVLAKSDVPDALPALIAKGNSKPSTPAPSDVLAYAAPVVPSMEQPVLRAPPAPKPAPVQALIAPKAALVAAKLDRTALASTKEAEAAKSSTELTGPATGLRQVAQRKAASPALMGDASSLTRDSGRLVSSFGVAAVSPLSLGHFEGPAVKALTPDDGFTQLESSTN